MNGRFDKSGQIINLISIDAANMEHFYSFLPIGITSILKIAASIYVLATLVSPYILTGISLVAISLCITFMLGKINKKLK